MPYLEDFQHDLFISYSMVNDELKLDNSGWVRGFGAELRTSLVNKLNKGGKNFDMFYAPRNHQAGDNIGKCITEVQQSAVLLIIGSPRWICDEWPQAEFTAFVKKFGSDKSRIFIAELEPPTGNLVYPEAIRDLIRIEFWRKTDKDNPIHLGDTAGLFREKLADIAGPIQRRLDEMADNPVKPERAPNPEFRKVLIAQATDDLVDDAEALAQALRQMDVPVLSTGNLPQTGPEFLAAFAALADQAEIVVQLLGPYPGRPPADFPKGFQAAQAETVLAKPGKTLLQWRKLNLELDAIADAAHRTLLNGPQVQESDLPDFKREVLRLATEPRRPAQPDPADPKDTRGKIFIAYDESDSETARLVAKKCIAEARKFSQPVHGEDSTKDWRDKYGSASKVLIIHEKSPKAWVGGQLRLYDKATARARPDVRILWLGPPEKDEAALPEYNPDFEIIKAPDGNLDPLYQELFK